MDFFERITDIDIQILDFIRENITCGFLNAVMPIITFLGNGGWFWIAAAVLMLFFRKTRKTALTAGAALILGLVICNIIIKPTVARIRPYDFVGGVELLVKAPTDFSFPSGHTAASFEAATAFMLCDRRFGIPALILAVLIAFSRLYLYVHYPSDVIAGAVIGILCAVLGYVIVDLIWKKVHAGKDA